MSACWDETRRTRMVIVAPLDRAFPARVAKIAQSRRCPGCLEPEHLVEYACGARQWVHERWLFPDVSGGEGRELAQLSPLVGSA